MNDEKGNLTRRELIVAGGIGILATAGVAGCRTASTPEKAGPPADPRVGMQNHGAKPVYVAQQGAKDPLALSLADTLFWTDILAEHATFFAMLMPGPELEEPREQAQEFHEQFHERFEEARESKLRGEDYIAFNRETIELVKPFISYKREMKAKQESGKLKSLVWPLFFEHTAQEAERFVQRLETFSKRNAEFERGEVVGFWSRIMKDHAHFIAHLLDPQEKELFEKALKSADTFATIESEKPANGEGDPVMAAALEMVDFKTAAAKGIESGKIKSIIHPSLADHVRREAVKFVDELKRV